MRLRPGSKMAKPSDFNQKCKSKRKIDVLISKKKRRQSQKVKFWLIYVNNEDSEVRSEVKYADQLAKDALGLRVKIRLNPAI